MVYGQNSLFCNKLVSKELREKSIIYDDDELDIHIFTSSKNMMSLIINFSSLCTNNFNSHVVYFYVILFNLNGLKIFDFFNILNIKKYKKLHCGTK